MNNSSSTIEHRSLTTGKWANLFMAIAGVTAAYLSHADALLVDGLYSGVNFFSAIVAAKISAAVVRPADRHYPWGYDAHEALYVTFRSLVLLGIIIFAVFGAGEKIFVYITGGEIPELVFGPILIYSVAMVVICFSLAGWHYYNWRRSGKQSELLITESKAAVVDGIISAGAGAALLAASLLRGGPLEFIIPIADSITVLLLSAIIVYQPIQMFLGALREIAGASADPTVVQQVRHYTTESLSDRPFEMLDVVVTKLGRIYAIVPYLKPTATVAATELDQLRNDLQEQYQELLATTVKTEVIITAYPPY